MIKYMNNLYTKIGTTPRYGSEEEKAEEMIAQAEHDMQYVWGEDRKILDKWAAQREMRAACPGLRAKIDEIPRIRTAADKLEAAEEMMQQAKQDFPDLFPAEVN